MFAIEILLIAGIGFLGILWQYKLIGKDLNNKDYPLRYLAPIILGAGFMLGLIFHGIIAICIDEKSNYEFGDLVSNLGKTFVIFITFELKSIFGVLFTALTICVSIYYFFEYSEIRIWSFLSGFFKWAFSKMPEGFEIVYKILLFLVSILWSSFDNLSSDK